MKITAQEEYGLRILIRIAGCKTPGGEHTAIVKYEGLTTIFAKHRILRLVDSSTAHLVIKVVSAGYAANESV